METRETQRQNFAWLLRLRWGAIAAQLVVFVAGDRLVHLGRPVLAILAITGVQSASNVIATLWARRARAVPELAVVAVMALDCLLLTALLALSGDDSNPFAVLYLINIALAGILLRPRWTWALAALSLACFTLLFLVRSQEARPEPQEDPREWQLREAWLAFGVTAATLVYFLQRTSGMLRQREEALDAARHAMERREKLAALATLAAGAAHELGTPLSTIAVVSKELQRQLENGAVGPDTLADARLIRQEVERCRGILAQMGSQSGVSPGESLQPVPLAELLRRAADSAGQPKRVELELQPELSACELRVPPRALEQALQSVIANALQASGELSVKVRARADADTIHVEVVDRGPGMDPATLARAGEPFFTTKEPGRGMGLGLFLTRSVLEQLGGSIELRSQATVGTTASIRLPRSLLG